MDMERSHVHSRDTADRMYSTYVKPHAEVMQEAFPFPTECVGSGAPERGLGVYDSFHMS